MIKKINKIIFTPSLFYQYSMCPHWIWYDIYGDPKQKNELPELTLKLFEHGVLHEAEYVKDLKFTEVKEVDPEKAFIQTMKLMKEGADLIYQGEIQYLEGDTLFRGRPDLLEKKKGESQFGDYYYTPVDIKSSKDIKKEQKSQLALYGLILEKLQNIYPEEVFIINREHARIGYIITKKDKIKMLEEINQILSVMRGSKPPLKVTSTYKQTPWYDVCLRDAEEVHDIALLYNLDARAHETLRLSGIKTIQDAAMMEIKTLPKVPYASITTLERIKLQAKSLINNEIKWIGKPVIPNTSLKIYFDIEGDPLLQIQYLFGFWVAGDPEGKYAKVGKFVFDKKEQKYFIYFLAEQPENEKKIWEDFLAWIELLPKNDFIVYHYADYERSRTKSMSEKYGTSDAFRNFFSKYVDFEKIVKGSVIFPIYFYSIKDIVKSRFVDFQWRHAKAGGAQSIFWYEKWLETGDKKVLQDIIDYNEDDVRATEFLHHWFIKNNS